MRALAIAAAFLAALPAVAGSRGASFHVGAQVVSSARVSTSASPAGLRLESRSFGGIGAAVLVQQRSGAPMRLLDGTLLPREDQPPLVVPAAAAGTQLALAPASSGEVVVVTLFPDGAPPARN